MDYLTMKWKYWYTYLDVNKDGKISMEDVEECRKKFTDLHKLAGEKAKNVNVDIEQWWNTYIFRAGAGKEISVDDFVSILSADYKKDKAGFKDSMQKCFEKVFDVIDMDKDRTIDLDEFVFAFRAFGHENEAVLKSVFDSYGQKKVPMKKLVDSWVQFVCDEDKSKKDVLLEAFKKGM
ncbi:sarcoplasmic calcium-binding protein-like [Saccostrea cucullata]|uniref:sarcoplasmic calcium-binding protein-like n=1 Tax=Saccostrea cuccullata TaxID=36930 RepID=UPI002ED2DD4A